MSEPTQCPTGYRLRKGYVRTPRASILRNGFTVRRKGKVYTVHPSQKQIHVPATCVRQRSTRKQSIGPLKKGDLIKYGYQFRLSDRMRQASLKKAVTAYGARSVYHKLDAVAKLSMHTAPDAHLVFSKDRDWVQTHYLG